MSEYKLYKKFKDKIVNSSKKENHDNTVRNVECNLAFRFW